MSDPVPLREYIEARLTAIHADMEQRERISQRALQKAEEALLVRLETMNEFRAQIQDERGTLARRVDLEAHNVRLYKVEAKTEELDRSVIRIDLSMGNVAGRLWTIGIALVISLGTGMVTFLATRTWTNWVVR